MRLRQETQHAEVQKLKETGLSFLSACLNNPKTIDIFTKTFQLPIEKYRFIQQHDCNSPIQNEEKTLELCVFPQKIIICETQKRQFKITIRVDSQNDQWEISTMVVGKTEDENSKYLFPKLFLSELIKFIQKHYEPTIFNAVWPVDSDNFSDFFTAIGNPHYKTAQKRLNMLKYKKRYLRATKQTWTGKLVHDLGYMTPTNLEIDDNEFIALQFIK